MEPKSIHKSMTNLTQNVAEKVMPNGGKRVPRKADGGRDVFGGPNTLRYVIRDATRRHATRRQSRRGAMARRIKAKSTTYPNHAPSRKRGGG